MRAWREEEATHENERTAADDEENNKPNDDSWSSISFVVKYALLLTLLVSGKSVVFTALCTYSISWAAITVRNAGNALVVIQSKTTCASDTSTTIASSATNAAAEALTLE